MWSIDHFSTTRCQKPPCQKTSGEVSVLHLRGQGGGYPQTRMDTGVDSVREKHTYIYKYLFTLDIYKYVNVGVRENFVSWFSVIALENWWVS